MKGGIGWCRIRIRYRWQLILPLSISRKWLTNRLSIQIHKVGLFHSKCQIQFDPFIYSFINIFLHDKQRLFGRKVSLLSMFQGFHMGETPSDKKNHRLSVFFVCFFLLLTVKYLQLTFSNLSPPPPSPFSLTIQG